MTIVKQIPIDKDGKVVKTFYYPNDWQYSYVDTQKAVGWKDNVPVNLILTYKHITSGGGYAFKFAFADNNGETWEVTGNDFEEFVPLMVNGVISSTFIVTKIRDYYHLKLFDPKKDKKMIDNPHKLKYQNQMEKINFKHNENN